MSTGDGAENHPKGQTDEHGWQSTLITQLQRGAQHRHDDRVSTYAADERTNERSGNAVQHEVLLANRES